MHALLAARDRADVGRSEWSLAGLEQEWSATSFSLEADAVVCELADGSLGGYGAMRPMHTVAAVMPGLEGRGIGSLLLGWAEGRERELGREQHRQAIASGNDAARGLLADAGYAYERSYDRMSIALEDAPPATSVPGVLVRLPRLPQDAHAIHAIDAESFADAGDYLPMTFEEFEEQCLSGAVLARELSGVAVEGGKVVGFLLAERWPEEHAGFVSALGVQPSHQRRGIGTALLTSALALFAAEGLREGLLGVASSNPEALRLYERLGMRSQYRFDAYQRPVARG